MPPFTFPSAYPRSVCPHTPSAPISPPRSNPFILLHPPHGRPHLCHGPPEGNPAVFHFHLHAKDLFHFSKPRLPIKGDRTHCSRRFQGAFETFSVATRLLARKCMQSPFPFASKPESQQLTFFHPKDNPPSPTSSHHQVPHQPEVVSTHHVVESVVLTPFPPNQISQPSVLFPPFTVCT